MVVIILYPNKRDDWIHIVNVHKEVIRTKRTKEIVRIRFRTINRVVYVILVLNNEGKSRFGKRTQSKRNNIHILRLRGHTGTKIR